MSSKQERRAAAAAHNALIERYGTANPRVVRHLQDEEARKARRAAEQEQRERIAADRQRRIDAGELDPGAVSEQHEARAYRPGQGSAFRSGMHGLGLAGALAMLAAIPPMRRK